MLKNTIKRSFIITLALLQIVFFPHTGFAVENQQHEGDHQATSHEHSEPQTGPQEPNGADSETYNYNESTGLWENEHYTWDPTTKKTAPKKPLEYSYNPETERWDTTEWRYDAAAGKYVPNVVIVAAPPSGAAATGVTDSPEHRPTALTASHDSSPETGTDSVNRTSNQNGAYDLFYDASISNKVKSIAQTGDASVLNNTTGGSAMTGNALTQATILNMLQSVWNPSNGTIATFNADIDGDVLGDLTIDPGQIPQNISVHDQNNKDLKLNISENTAINNEIDLAAASGDALVDHNSQGGDATTGTAAAVANVVNLINSVIGSGQSFVGTVNINGNLNGDILLPPQMLDQLLASNVPRATISTDTISNGNVLGEFNNKQTITNTITADADSGNANVINNSAAGNATTGSANSNITVLNLTGREIVGSNAMLVFVNVLGEWVGMIMDAPGATSAAVGGGITSDTANNLNTEIEANSTQTISNDIKLAAKTGDATISNNSKAGSAKSGDASTSANIANVADSKVSVGGWFGVLFINVFGKWFGSFGKDTTAGTVNAPAPAAQAPTQQAEVKVFQFTPSETEKNSTLTPVPTVHNLVTATNTETPADPGLVLGASTAQPEYGGVSFTSAPNTAQMYIGLATIGLAITLIGRLIGYMRARKLSI